jgi:hypothetical protein
MASSDASNTWRRDVDTALTGVVRMCVRSSEKAETRKYRIMFYKQQLVAAQMYASFYQHVLVLEQNFEEEAARVDGRRRKEKADECNAQQLVQLAELAELNAQVSKLATEMQSVAVAVQTERGWCACEPELAIDEEDDEEDDEDDRGDGEEQVGTPPSAGGRAMA